MPDLLMTASSNAIALARSRGSEEVTPDDLLVGALRALGRLDVAILGPVVIDLRSYVDRDRTAVETDGEAKPAYTPETAAAFDRAAALARRDGEPRVRVAHVLAAIRPVDSPALRHLMSEHEIDETGWRAALAEWDPGANGRDPASAGGERVLSVDDAAEFLDVHPQTIRGYIRSGKLPAYRIGGERVIRIFSSDLYDLLEPLEPDEPSTDAG